MRALIAAVLLATAPALADEPAGQPMAEGAGDDADRLFLHHGAVPHRRLGLCGE